MLYLVGTPIGNLDDITFRALQTLKDVDYIFAENTRHTKNLLNRFEIKKIVYIYNECNKRHQIENILNLISNENKKIAIVTDAGMPCVSDPGYELVEAAYLKDIKVTVIPGVSAVTTAVSISGISMKRFAYEGFLPKKKGRQTLFNKLKLEERNIIIFESPNRVIKTLNDINKYLGNRFVIIARELTKIYEEVITGYSEELFEKYKDHKFKGEIVLIVKTSEQDKCTKIDLIQ